MTAIAENKGLDVQGIRNDFPILRRTVRGKPLVYLDNAATSQKPEAVIETVDRFYRESNANIHRGVHWLSQEATRMYDEARERVRVLLNAAESRECIMTKGCTEGINLVASCLTTMGVLGEGDTVLLSTMEHHSNIVPWQIAAEKVGAKVVPIPITDSGEVDMDAYQRLLAEHRVKVVGIVHVSNSLGTVNPVKEIVRLAHEAGALAMVDGAQAGPHLAVDVQDIDADFYTLSCHKIYSPTGVGVLYGKRSLLEAMPPYHGGGDMIRTVSFEKTTYAELPMKFEAGTPHMAGVIGLGAAIGYLASLSGWNSKSESGLRESLVQTFDAIHAHELRLAKRAEEQLSSVPGLRLTGTAPDKSGIVAFTMEGAHPHDIGTILDMEGIAIRAGHHCCMPLMKRLNVPATARASFALYSTEEEVEALVGGVRKVRELLA
jgi:cysteine desulfurase/selenocysteine lyase